MPGLWGGPGAVLCGPSGGGGSHALISLGGGPISSETAVSYEVGPSLVESVLSSAGYGQCWARLDRMRDPLWWCGWSCPCCLWGGPAAAFCPPGSCCRFPWVIPPCPGYLGVMPFCVSGSELRGCGAEEPGHCPVLTLQYVFCHCSFLLMYLTRPEHKTEGSHTKSYGRVGGVLQGGK